MFCGIFRDSQTMLCKRTQTNNRILACFCSMLPPSNKHRTSTKLFLKQLGILELSVVNNVTTLKENFHTSDKPSLKRKTINFHHKKNTAQNLLVKTS